MRYRTLVLTVCLSALFSCTNDKKPNEKSADLNDTTSYIHRTALDIEPSLKKVDSLQIIYYDNPDGDSLRYARFFSYVNTKDSSVINIVNKQLNETVSYLNAVKPCRSEGKIFLYQGAEPLKILYFSTRCDSCCYVYLIKDGGFMYMPLQHSFREIIVKNKSLAQKP